VSGQDVGFQMEEEFSMGSSGCLHFCSERSRSDRTWNVVHL